MLDAGFSSDPTSSTSQRCSPQAGRQFLIAAGACIEAVSVLDCSVEGGSSAARSRLSSASSASEEKDTHAHATLAGTENVGPSPPSSKASDSALSSAAVQSSCSYVTIICGGEFAGHEPTLLRKVFRSAAAAAPVAAGAPASAGSGGAALGSGAALNLGGGAGFGVSTFAERGGASKTSEGSADDASPVAPPRESADDCPGSLDRRRRRTRFGGGSSGSAGGCASSSAASISPCAPARFVMIFSTSAYSTTCDWPSARRIPAFLSAWSDGSSSSSCVALSESGLSMVTSTPPDANFWTLVMK
mmetsp:Transcript_20771/g.66908  ORF Transcript_20771/g.66908 Transcript_20771/m.66908 type:complete len:302 (+) Transcript_20771:635-1540(+)